MMTMEEGGRRLLTFEATMDQNRMCLEGEGKERIKVHGGIQAV
jgi:hypothetical protein